MTPDLDLIRDAHPVAFPEWVEEGLRQELEGKYRPIARLGGGGSGIIWKVELIQWGRPRALKILKFGGLAPESWRSRFNREIEALRSIDEKEDNVVRFYDGRFYDADRSGYIEMEFVDGETLTESLVRRRDGPIDWRWARRVVAQLCRGVQAIHSAGSLHRDLKPANLMLVSGRPPGDELLKVVDLGIARPLEVDADDPPTQFLGTPAYCSYEQMTGDHRRSNDTYSIGVILYQMLTGSLPYSSIGRLGFIEQHRSTEPPRFAEFGLPHPIPEAVEAVVRKSLHKDPGERYQSAELLARDFDDALRVGLRPAPPPRGPESGPDVRADRSPSPSEGRPAPKAAVPVARPAPPRIPIKTGPREGDEAEARSPWELHGWAWSILAHAILLLILGLWYFGGKPSEVRTFDTRLVGSEFGVDEGLTALGGLDTPVSVPEVATALATESTFARLQPTEVAANPLAGFQGGAGNPGAGLGEGFGLAKFGDGGESVRGVAVKVGDPQFTLLWDSKADIDLHVIEPGGKEIYWNEPRGRLGGELDVDNVEGFGPENIYWLKQSPDGSKELGPGPPGVYRWFVLYYGGNGGVAAPTRWKVRVKHEGRVEVFQDRLTVPGSRSKVYTLTVGGP